MLGLASMSRTIACQRARIRNLEEGDANTRFFHLQACHRKRKKFIPTLEDDGQVLSDQDAKSEKIYTYFSEVLGTSFLHCHRIDLNALSLPRLQLEELVRCFSEEEIWNIVKETPRNRAPGPDGYTGLFYKTTLEIIKQDVIGAFNTIKSLDGRSFYLLNDAQMILLPKIANPNKVKDFRPISVSANCLLRGWRCTLLPDCLRLSGRPGQSKRICQGKMYT